MLSGLFTAGLSSEFMIERAAVSPGAAAATSVGSAYYLDIYKTKNIKIKLY